MILNLKKYITEFLGTLILVFVGLSTSGNWLAIGAALAICVYLGGPISGGSYNPAITISYLATNKINTPEFVLYIVFEILGGMLGICLFKMLPSRR
jgi:glycerol uptake facilitator-like aquaporin